MSGKGYKMNKKNFLAICFLLLMPIYANAEKSDLNQYEKIMIDKVWLTTQALDENGKQLPPSDEHVSSFFGLAQYSGDGTFKMLTLNFEPKISGDWLIDDKGQTRTLTAKDSTGKILFTRVVDNITVSPTEYTYRVFPDPSDKTKYFDIIHKPLF